MLIAAEVLIAAAVWSAAKTVPVADCPLSPPLPFLWPGSTVGPGGKHAPGGALPASARQRLASALVAENEGQRMALASKTALISHHLLRDQREGLGEMPGMWMRRPRGRTGPRNVT